MSSNRAILTEYTQSKWQDLIKETFGMLFIGFYCLIKTYDIFREGGNENGKENNCI